MKFAPRRNKFNAKRTEYVSPLVGARTYDSMAEAARAMQLDLLWRSGEILFWLPQPSFPIAGGTYRGDFQIHWADGRVTFEDVKGRDTTASKLKRAFVKDRYGVDIEIVRMK